MYSAYLSYTQVQEYLTFLQDRGLLMFVEGLQQYKVTGKGLNFLRACDQINEIVGVEKTPEVAQSAQPAALPVGE
jgi:predicted transcriptional regulator